MKPIFKTASSLALAAALAGSLAGCIPSETLTQIIYAQDDQFEIDYDAPKVIKNSVDADQQIDQLPALTTSDGNATDKNESLPHYGDDIDDEQVEQSEDERVEDSQNRAPEQQASDEGEATDGAEQGSGTAQGDGTAGETSDSGGAAAGDKGGGKKKSEKKDKKRSNTGTTPGKSFNDVGDNDDLPDGVRSVAAVGNAAIVAAVLGGEDGTQNLVAANKGLLGNKQFKKVLSSKLNGSYVDGSLKAPKQIWAGDGDAASTLTAEKLAALIELAPDAVLVSENETTLDEAAAAQVLEAGIHIVYVPSMSSPTKIKACVERVGTLLSRGGDAAATQLAADYSAYHDEVYGRYASESATKYSLYVSNWEKGVTYKRSKNRPAWSGTAKDGVAVTAVGQSSLVPGLYLQQGGVENTATTKPMFSQKLGKSIAWQVAGGTLVGGTSSEWTQNGAVGVAGVTEELPSGSGFSDSSLFCAVVNSTMYRLGDDAFPAVIVKTSGMKKSFDADRKRANGLYAYYDPTSGGSSGGISTAITSKGYEVVVNPSGLFSSWAGGSMESVLEVPWARAQFHTGDFSDLKATAADFYRKFYGYAPADFSSDYDNIVKAKNA